MPISLHYYGTKEDGTWHFKAHNQLTINTNQFLHHVTEEFILITTEFHTDFAKVDFWSFTDKLT